MQTLSTQQILDAGLDDWRKLAQALHARFVFAEYATGAAFVGAVAAAAQASDHHPELTLRGDHVDLALCTHESGRWVTAQDVELARTISAIAREHGLEPQPAEVTQVELGLDTADDGAVAPFWAALLTGDAGNRIHDSVIDPTGRVPMLWFQGTHPHETPKQRFHIDLWVAPEVADARIAAAVAAGGSVVYDGHAPSYTMLADPDGNRVCVCTSTGRD